MSRLSLCSQMWSLSTCKTASLSDCDINHITFIYHSVVAHLPLIKFSAATHVETHHLKRSCLLVESLNDILIRLLY